MKLSTENIVTKSFFNDDIYSHPWGEKGRGKRGFVLTQGQKQQQTLETTFTSPIFHKYKHKAPITMMFEGPVFTNLKIMFVNTKGHA